MPANIYKTLDGVRVPGCTTICGQLDKPALIKWAHRIGYDSTIELIKKAFSDPARRIGELTVPNYEDVQKPEDVRDSAGDRGTDVHDMIMRFWKGEEVVMVGDIQTKCFGNFLEWLKTHRVEPILIEEPLVSERYKYGGQPDLYARINDKLTLLDIKTGKAVYAETWYQLAGYDILLSEHGRLLQQYQVLRLGQDGTWEDPVRTELKKEKRIFKDLLDIYYQRRV